MNKRVERGMSGKYKYIYFDDGSEMIENDGDYLTNMEEATEELNKQDKDIQRLKLSINGLNYALKNIRQIDVEIDLNECGDLE